MNYESYINDATAKFEAILREQLDRAQKMKDAAPALDFANMDKIIIGTCGGDGIGPIITEWAKKILTDLLADEIASGKVEIRDIEGLTLENRFACGQSVPDAVLAAIKVTPDEHAEVAPGRMKIPSDLRGCRLNVFHKKPNQCICFSFGCWIF